MRGDDVIAAAVIPMYAKQLWPLLAQALAAAQAGDGSLIRQLTDEFIYGPQTGNGPVQSVNGPLLHDRWVRAALHARHRLLLEAGDHAWGTFAHFYFNTGYTELNYGLYPVHDTE